jgi:hypothetical protein
MVKRSDRLTQQMSWGRGALEVSEEEEDSVEVSVGEGNDGLYDFCSNLTEAPNQLGTPGERTVTNSYANSTGSPTAVPNKELRAVWTALLHLLSAIWSLPPITEVWNRSPRLLEQGAGNETTESDQQRAVSASSCPSKEDAAGTPQPEVLWKHGAWKPLTRYRNWLLSHTPSVSCSLSRLTTSVVYADHTATDLSRVDSDTATAGSLWEPSFVLEPSRHTFWIRARMWMEDSFLSNALALVPGRLTNQSENISGSLHSIQETPANPITKRWRIFSNVFLAYSGEILRQEGKNRSPFRETLDENAHSVLRSTEIASKPEADLIQGTLHRYSSGTGASLDTSSRIERCPSQAGRIGMPFREKPGVLSDLCDDAGIPDASDSITERASTLAAYPEGQHEYIRMLKWQVRLPWPQKIWNRDDKGICAQSEAQTGGANDYTSGMETWRAFHTFSRDFVWLSSWLTLPRFSLGRDEWNSDDEPPLDPSAPLIISAARSDDMDSIERAQDVLPDSATADDRQHLHQRNRSSTTFAGSGNMDATHTATSAPLVESMATPREADAEYVASTASATSTPSMTYGRLPRRLQQLRLNLHLFSSAPRSPSPRHDQLANMGSSSFEDLSALDRIQRGYSDAMDLFASHGLDSETIEKYTCLSSLPERLTRGNGVQTICRRDRTLGTSTASSRLDSVSQAQEHRSVSELSPPQSQADHCVICLEPMQYPEVVRILPCLHFYHKVCVDQWLYKRKRCPVCNGNIEELAMDAFARRHGRPGDTRRLNETSNQPSATYPESMLSRAIQIREHARRTPSPTLLFPNEDPVELIESQHAWRDWFQGPVPHEL